MDLNPLEITLQSQVTLHLLALLSQQGWALRRGQLAMMFPQLLLLLLLLPDELSQLLFFSHLLRGVVRGVDEAVRAFLVSVIYDFIYF